MTRRGLLTVASLVLGAVLLVRSLDGVSAFEGLSLAAMVVGVAVAAGPRRGRASRMLRAEDHHLADLAQDVLATLDPVEHRRLELGEPWPQLVVGPTGVTIIDLCRTEPTRPRPDGAGRRDPTMDGDCAVCGALHSVSTAIRDLLAERAHERAVPVRALAVVGQGGMVGPAHDAAIMAVPPDLLRDTLVRGPMLPMATVEDVFRFLTQRAAGGWVRPT